MSDSSPRRQAHVALTLIVCDLCGVPFGIPQTMFDGLVANRLKVCCPSGHVRPMGEEPPHETRIRQLELLVAEHGERLISATEENDMLRRTIVDRLLGPTAPEAL